MLGTRPESRVRSCSASVHLSLPRIIHFFIIIFFAEKLLVDPLKYHTGTILVAFLGLSSLYSSQNTPNKIIHHFTFFFGLTKTQQNLLKDSTWTLYIIFSGLDAVFKFQGGVNSDSIIFLCIRVSAPRIFSFHRCHKF